MSSIPVAMPVKLPSLPVARSAQPPVVQSAQVIAVPVVQPRQALAERGILDLKRTAPLPVARPVAAPAGQQAAPPPLVGRKVHFVAPLNR